MALLIPLCLISLEIFLNILAVGTAINATLVLLIITAPVWLLLIVFWWPMLIAIAFMLKCSSIRTYFQSCVLAVAHYILYRHRGQLRKQCWSGLYGLLSLGLPNSIVAQNCGFALVSVTGDSFMFRDHPGH